MADEAILITGKCSGLDRPFEGGSPTCELTAGLTLLLLRDDDRHFYKAAHTGRIIYVPKHSSRLLRREEVRSDPEIDGESQDLPSESFPALGAKFTRQEARGTRTAASRQGARRRQRKQVSSEGDGQKGRGLLQKGRMGWLAVASVLILASLSFYVGRTVDHISNTPLAPTPYVSRCDDLLSAVAVAQSNGGLTALYREGRAEGCSWASP